MTPPRPSTVKVRDAIRGALEHLPELQQQASGLNAVMLAPLVSFAPRLQEMALERLPDDPAVLDLLLERAAELILDLRSDPPPIPATATEETTP